MKWYPAHVNMANVACWPDVLADESFREKVCILAFWSIYNELHPFLPCNAYIRLALMIMPVL